MPARDAMPKAKAAALKALELDHTLALARAALAYVRCIYDWDFLAAEQDFKEAVRLNPGYATAHQWYSICLTVMQRHDDAVAEATQAQHLDPLSLIINCGIGIRHYYARQYGLAIRVCLKTLEIEPHFAMAHEYLGRVYEATGMYGAAIDEYRAAIGIAGRSPTCLMGLGRAHALAGKKHEAEKQLDELRDMFNRRRVGSFDIAMILAALGENDDAFRWLEKAYDERSGWLAYLNVDPRCDDLRSDRAFQPLAGRIGPSS
jgi:tetratricopeptide (TPR) repeat protein